MAQIDRYKSQGQGTGAIAGGKRFYVTQDEDLQPGELQESWPTSATSTCPTPRPWSISSPGPSSTYPADKYVLILSDHGMGWPGGWSDASSPKRPAGNVPLASRRGNQIYLMDLDKALGDIRSRTGLDKFELIGMDACLMSQLEVYTRAGAPCPLRGGFRGDRAGAGLGLHLLAGRTGAQSGHQRRRPGQADRQELHPGRPAHRR